MRCMSSGGRVIRSGTAGECERRYTRRRSAAGVAGRWVEAGHASACRFFRCERTKPKILTAPLCVAYFLTVNCPSFFLRNGRPRLSSSFGCWARHTALVNGQIPPKLFSVRFSFSFYFILRFLVRPKGVTVPLFFTGSYGSLTTCLLFHPAVIVQFHCR